MRIGIFDENNIDRKITKNNIIQYFNEHLWINAQILDFEDSFSFLKEQDKNFFDVVFLNVNLTNIGIEIAKRIRHSKALTQIIFVSNTNDFALEGFDLNVIHYLLKPLDKLKLRVSLDRALQSLEKDHKNLVLKSNFGLKNILIDEIEYVECFSHILSIHLMNEVIEIRKSLASLYEHLNMSCTKLFTLCTKGMIVNLSKIRVLTKKNIIVESGTLLPVSQRQYCKVKEDYMNYRY